MKYPHEPLSKCDNIILEAKRVLLNEQLDKIANMTLSDEHKLERFNETLCYCPNISDESEPEGLTEITSSDQNIENLPKNESKNFPEIKLVFNKAITKRYFNKWKKIVKTKTNTTEKLEDFITNLKNHQHNEPPNTSSANKPIIKNYKNPSELYKNRFKSQKHIIDLQRSKIDEQTKIINELKLGIIREDLLKSMENTKIEIREIFSNCSVKLLAQAPMLQAIDEREKMMVTSQKAPKVFQKIQRRAIERAKYREIILKRKKIIEETRQKLLEEAIEKKKALEEEERKRNLDIINDQRKKELYLQKIRQEKKQEYERKLLIATNFHKKLLKQQSFKKLLINYLKSKENYTLATAHYCRKQKVKIFKSWWENVEAKYKIKYDIADAHYEFKLLRETFDNFKEFKLNCKRSMQVAEDVYDLRLTSNTFIYWHRYVCKQIMLESKKIQIAIKHFNRRLIFQYFYQWRSLPTVLQLEKAKEEKKRKWRERVWEILPDYQPPEQL